MSSVSAGLSTDVILDDLYRQAGHCSTDLGEHVHHLIAFRSATHGVCDGFHPAASVTRSRPKLQLVEHSSRQSGMCSLLRLQ